MNEKLKNEIVLQMILDEIEEKEIILKKLNNQQESNSLSDDENRHIEKKIIRVRGLIDGLTKSLVIFNFIEKRPNSKRVKTALEKVRNEVDL